MRILFVGDVFGSAGRRIVREHIGHIITGRAVDLVIVTLKTPLADSASLRLLPTSSSTWAPTC